MKYYYVSGFCRGKRRYGVIHLDDDFSVSQYVLYVIGLECGQFFAISFDDYERYLWSSYSDFDTLTGLRNFENLFCRQVKKKIKKRGKKNMKNVIEVPMTFTDKSFRDPVTNEIRDYVEIVGIVCGEAIRFTVKKEDKTLLGYLRKGMHEVKEK